MIDLQFNDALKIKHSEDTWVDFYKFLPGTQYPNLRKISTEYNKLSQNEIHQTEI